MPPAIQRVARQGVERLLLAPGIGWEGHAGATARVPDLAVALGTQSRAPTELLGRAGEQGAAGACPLGAAAPMSQPITSGKEVSGKAVTPR